MLEVVINRGVPGSGKSTYAHAWVMAQFNRVRVNRDDIRMQGYGVEFGPPINEDVVTKIENGYIESALKAGISVIVDDCNIEPKYVKNLAYMAWRYGATARVQEFIVPLSQALENNKRRAEAGGRFVPESAISRMFERMHPVSLPEFPKIEPYVPRLEMPDAILYDLDGTVALMGDRDPFDFSRVSEDKVNQRVADIIRLESMVGTTAIAFSGRDDSCYDDTVNWLADGRIPRNDLFMRKTGDKRKDAVVKLEMFNEHIRNVYNVKYVLDDRGQVVDMWRVLGLTCLQVAPGDF